MFPEKLDDLLRLAKDNVGGSKPMYDEYWKQLVAVCAEAREYEPALFDALPDESQKTWAEAVKCLSVIRITLYPPGP